MGRMDTFFPPCDERLLLHVAGVVGDFRCSAAPGSRASKFSRQNFIIGRWARVRCVDLESHRAVVEGELQLRTEPCALARPHAPSSEV